MSIRSSQLLDAQGRPFSYRSSSRIVMPVWVAPTNSIQYRGVACSYAAHDEALNFERTDPFSIEAYVRLDGSRTAGGIDRVIYHKRPATEPATGVLVSTNNTNKLYLYLGNTVSGNNFIKVTDTVALSTLTWYHVIWTYDGSSTAAGSKIYVSGAVRTCTVDKDTLSLSIQNTEPVILGWQGQGTNYFDGELCDLVIYNKELSAAEVATLYNSGTPLDPRSVATAANIIVAYRLGTGDVTWPFISPFVGGQPSLTPYTSGRFLATICGVAAITTSHP